MIGFILWLAGLVCCIWCIKDVWTKNHVDTLIKILITVALLCLGWIGFAVYYFILKDRFKEKSDEFLRGATDYGTNSSTSRNSKVISRERLPLATDYGTGSATLRNINDLYEFRDYLNSHESWEWESELEEILSRNNWEDRTDEEDMICSDGRYTLSYDRYEGKYEVNDQS